MGKEKNFYIAIFINDIETINTKLFTRTHTVIHSHTHISFSEFYAIDVDNIKIIAYNISFISTCKYIDPIVS